MIHRLNCADLQQQQIPAHLFANSNRAQLNIKQNAINVNATNPHNDNNNNNNKNNTNNNNNIFEIYNVYLSPRSQYLLQQLLCTFQLIFPKTEVKCILVNKSKTTTQTTTTTTTCFGILNVYLNSWSQYLLIQLVCTFQLIFQKQTQVICILG
jgi:hypothetical protein